LPGAPLARHLDARWRYVGGVLLLAGGYWAAAKIGLRLAYLDGAVTALWPPVGVGIAVLVLYGPRLWPGIVIGDLLVADFTSPLGTVLGQTAGNTLEVVIAALILRRLAGPRVALTRVVEVFALVACAAVGTLVSASFGSTSLRLGDVIPPHEYFEVWRTWWLSDFSGALVVTPFLLTWIAGGPVRFTRRQVVEGVVLLTVLVLLAEVPSQRDVPYVVFPALIWAALRFGPRGAASAVLLASSLTVLNTAHNAGPFVRESITDSLLSTQLFMATAALTSLVLAAVTAERSVAGTALLTNEERLRSVVRSMNEGLIVRDARGLITDCNGAAEHILGVSREALSGRRPEDVIGRVTDEDGQTVDAGRLLGDGGIESGLVARLGRPDDTWAWIAASSSAMQDAAGRPEGVVTTLSDITQRRMLAAEQAALRRIATLVAGDAPPRAVFALVTEEVGRLLGLPSASIVRYEADARATIVGSWVTGVDNGLPVGTRFALEGDTVVALVRRTGEPARLDSYQGVKGQLAEHLRGQGYGSSVAAPVQVGGRLWGVLVTSAYRPGDLPHGAEERLLDFAELVAQAIANADAHEKLAASRIRLVEAGDSERRRLERNLHDGAQQRLVALAVRLRLIQSRLEHDPAAAHRELDQASAELSGALEELRELARGIHPAVLTDRGLAAAVVALADRAPVPVDIGALPEERLSPAVEAAAYYIISEAVTNVAKYARASHVSVLVRDDGACTLVEVADDGVGGADPAKGSGLRGIADRVEALQGRLSVTSPPGAGTRIEAEIPSRR
jgi:PAS domain S-box-containing protein